MSPTGFRYFVTFVDDYSRTTWLYLLKNRFELFSHFHAFCAEIHTQFHVYVQNLRSDNAKEYVLEQFQSFMLQQLEAIGISEATGTTKIDGTSKAVETSEVAESSSAVGT